MWFVFQPHDVARLATMLETSATEAAEMSTLIKLADGARQVVLPQPEELLEHMRATTPWPPRG